MQPFVPFRGDSTSPPEVLLPETAPPETPISYPARYAPGVAVNFADTAGNAVIVSDASPLPVMLAGTSGDPATTAPLPPPLVGSTGATLSAGPFAAVVGRPIVLTLTGEWTGTVTLLRSIDGGATRLPLTLAGSPWATFTANACEPVWEESEETASFYLQLVPVSGTIAYRLAQ